MKARKTAIFLAITLMLSMMAVLPAQAATTSYDMEEWTTATEDAISVPVGFTVVPGTGAEITCDTEAVAGNTSKKMKIVHTEETTTTVSVTVLDKDYLNTYFEVYWSFFLGEDFEGTGLKMTQTRGNNGVTDYFKDNTYTWWRKMMIGSMSHAYKSAINVEFTGKGTVYLDDVTWKMPYLIMNGNFEGVSADGRPAGYAAPSEISDGSSTVDTGLDSRAFPWRSVTLESYKRTAEDTTALEKGNYFIETPTGNYLEFVDQTRATSISYIASSTAAGTELYLKSGKSYDLLVSHQSTNGKNGLGYSFTGGFAATTPTYSNSGQNWTKATKEWTEKCWTGVYMLGTTQGRLMFALHPHSAKVSTASPVAVCRIDNVRIRETEEKVMLSNADGESINNLVNGQTVKVTLEKPLFDLTDEFDTVKVTGAKSGKSVAVYAALYDMTGAAPRLTDVKINGEVRAESVSCNGEVPIGPADTLGFCSAVYPVNFVIPETGDYMVKLFVLDSAGTLIPKSEEVYTFTTATAAEA
ncbi:MAG: hypothetical protein E7390_03425 [Ruminococcaceae bacterium]|nr:hypothetical protein [Oscillospiraceae bacterium]